jgi:Tol biopolymer transport system component
VVPTGGAATAVTISYWDPTWAPHGNVIAFVDRGDSEGDLYTVGADGLGLRKLTSSSYASGNYGARNPSWSPDGSKIAFGYGYWGISAISRDGSGLTRLRKTGDMPAWSPRGKRIAFADPDWPAASIWVMRPDGTGKMLVALPPPDERSLFGPAWSPDGQRLAFCVGTAADSTVRPGYLAIVSSYRGRFEKLLKGLNPSSVDWSPDGRKLAITFDPVTNDPRGFTNARIGVFDLRTKRLRQLHFGVHPTWSPNGRRLAFSYEGDIWVINANGLNAQRLTHRLS